MGTSYTSERNVLTVIALLKAHGIRKIVASPGTTNMTFVASLQQDDFFEMYSSADERSAAYIACGLAAETGEPVVISCTGATASRNYLPGLTEAYYRKLPVLAVTSAQHIGNVGNGIPQVIDRSAFAADTVRVSVLLPTVHSDQDQWACEVLANRAITELRRRGGGPAHINLVTTYSKDFSVKELPSVRAIRRVAPSDAFPALPEGRIGVFAGAHLKWDDALTRAVDAFCAAHDAVVFCDQTSNYFGKYRVLPALAGSQLCGDPAKLAPKLLIHMGDISGNYSSYGLATGAEVWRVSPDGNMADTFKRLRYVFEMDERLFFSHYAETSKAGGGAYFAECRGHMDCLCAQLPELPFSNIWMASRMASKIPAGSAVHFGILHSLRSWNLFQMPEGVHGYSNTGGFGIDGGMSSLLGASLADRDKLYFGIFGDLAFFYDMNCLGNRHLGRNVRILLVNNGKGTEFRNFIHPAYDLGERAEAFVAASGHYGCKSPNLVRHYAEDLGFEYLCASGKGEFDAVYERFLTPRLTERPMLFEAFTTSDDENTALSEAMHFEKTLRGNVKEWSKQALGTQGVRFVKKILRKE